MIIREHKIVSFHTTCTDKSITLKCDDCVFKINFTLSFNFGPMKRWGSKLGVKKILILNSVAKNTTFEFYSKS